MRAASMAVCVALLTGTPAVAEESGAMPPLPQLAQCRNPNPRPLPEKWHAAFLMASFSRTQLVLADIVEDGTLPAMRARLYGVRRGSLDLLVADEQTYVLSGEEGRRECRRLGDTGWRPLPRDWLGGRSQCT